MKILTLPTKKLQLAMYEYNEQKHNKVSAYICRWFGWYRIYTGQILLRILFLITLLFGIWIIRWILDAFQVNDYITKKNNELDDMLYKKYR